MLNINMEEKFNDLLKHLLSEIEKFKFLFSIDDTFKLVSWLKESIIINKIIKSTPDSEKVQRPRSHVFWINFGYRIGSEFSFPHFCVVIKELSHTAIIAPVTSVKENEATWKKNELVVPIGKIDNLPNAVDSYVLLNQITTVSKKRLSNFKLKHGDFIKLKLSSDKMDLIDSAIVKLTKDC